MVLKIARYFTNKLHSLYALPQFVTSDETILFPKILYVSTHIPL